MTERRQEKKASVLLRSEGLGSIQPRRDGSFKFVVSTTTSPGVDQDESGALAREFARRVADEVRQWTIHSSVLGIVVFPRIIDERIAKIPDHLTYKRKEKAVFIGVNIPFDKWIGSSVDEKICCLANVLIVALERIPLRYLHSKDRDQFVLAVVAARDAMRVSVK